MYKKKTSFHKIIWTGSIMFDITNKQDITQFAGESDYRISSFIIDDLNNDDVRDLLVGVDYVTEDGTEKTAILRAMQVSPGEKGEGVYTFAIDRIDPDCGRFIIVSAATFENKDYKDIIVMLKNQKVSQYRITIYSQP